MAPGKAGPREDCLVNALAMRASAALARASEGEALFNPVATLLDDYKRSAAARSLAQHQKQALEAFADDISRVATRHFDAFISGNKRPPPPYTATAPPSPPPTPRTNNSSPPPLAPAPQPASTTSIPSQPAGSYAQALARKRPAGPTHPKPNKAKLARDAPDSRIFVRLSDTHKARTFAPYAVLTRLRTEVEAAHKHLKDVQPVKSGFALVSSSAEGSKALVEQSEALEAFFGDCTVEQACRWTSYRVSNLPRTVGAISDEGQPTAAIVTGELLTTAIREAIGHTPIRCAEAPASAANTNNYSTSWFVNFREGDDVQLPRNLHLLGVQGTAKLMARKVSTIQCSRCFQWHNERACARAARCRLCGSTKHAETNHSTQCTNSADGHACPLRCLHCLAPHAADSPDCLLRRNPKSARLAKSQRNQIRSAGAAARMRACAQAGCSLSTCTSTTPPQNEEEMDTSGGPTQRPQGQKRPATPPTPTNNAPPSTPPVTKHAVRFSTPACFAALNPNSPL